EEDDRLLGRLRVRFARVVGVVKADADDLARPRDRGARAPGGRHAGSRCGVQADPAREPCEAVGIQEALAPVLAEGRGVDARPVAELQPGLLAARGAETG